MTNVVYNTYNKLPNDKNEYMYMYMYIYNKTCMLKLPIRNDNGIKLNWTVWRKEEGSNWIDSIRVKCLEHPD